MNTLLNRSHLRTRYRITGHLILDTALHIGGGRNPLAGTDSPVVRDGVGNPFIPGSSLKGAFRAAVERIVPNLGLNACGLGSNHDRCVSVADSKRDKAYRVVRAALGRGPGDEERRALTALGKQDLDRSTIDEDLLLDLLEQNLCDVCKTFGSPYLASAIFFHDAPIVAETWVGLTQVRDGVGIDRDSERAREGIKYDFEVVPPQVAFHFGLTVEHTRPADLGLVALGLQELIQGMVPLGGIRSRGLGRCHLEKENLAIENVNFADSQALKRYLLKGEMATEPIEAFISDSLKVLLNGGI